MAIVQQQVSAFLMAHQLQTVVDEDQCDAPIERMINRQFADCTVQLFDNWNDRSHGPPLTASPEP
jgi:hypothetical protein